MSEWRDAPITTEVTSIAGLGVQTASVQLSQGLHEVLVMRAGVVAPVHYGQRTSIGFYMLRSDGSIVYQSLKEGWISTYHDVILEGSRQVVGPGALYAQTYFDVDNAVDLVVTFRRVLP